MSKTFEDFPVYKKGLDLVGQVEGICNGVRGGRYNFITDQLRRAASSIILNIAEGSGKWSKRDKINFYRMSQASTNECLAAMDLLFAYKLIDLDRSIEIKEVLRDIILDLHALKKGVERRI